jgi:AcrR family transcriptional regulator
MKRSADASRPAARPRGRPRSFDEKKVLGAVLDTFWTRGYAATSLDDLAAAGQVKRPSLYAAFGGKEEMYLRAFALFEARLTAELGRCLDPSRPLAEGLAAMYRGAIDTYLAGPAGPRGCLAVCTATTAAVEEPAIRAALQGVLTRLDEGLAARFRAARAAGEIPPGPPAKRLAQIAAGSLHSIAIRARAGTAKRELLALAAAAVTLLAGAPAPKHTGRTRRGPVRAVTARRT